MKFSAFIAIAACTVWLAATPSFAGGYDFGKVDKNSSPSDWGDKLEGQHDDWNVDTTPSGAMFQVLTELASVKPDPGWYHNPCERAAINAAWDIWGNGQGTGISKAWGQAFKDIGSNLWGLAGSGVEEYVAEQIKDGVKGKLKDKIKDYLKGKKVKSEAFKMSGTRGNCNYVMYVVADPVNSVVDVVISGNCGCKLQRCYDAQQSVKLAAFALHLQAPFNYKVGADKIEGVTVGTFRKIFFKADCASCQEKDSSTAVPPGGGSTTTPGGGTTEGGGTSTTPGPKPEVKTCPPCQDKGDDLEALLDKRDNLSGELRNVQNKIIDAERDGKDAEKAQYEARQKTLEGKLKEIDAKIKELEAKKEACEKKKCGISYEDNTGTSEEISNDDNDDDTARDNNTAGSGGWGAFSVGVGMGHKIGRESEEMDEDMGAREREDRFRKKHEIDPMIYR